MYMQKHIDIFGLQTADTGGTPRYMHNAHQCCNLQFITLTIYSHKLIKCIEQIL